MEATSYVEPLASCVDPPPVSDRDSPPFEQSKPPSPSVTQIVDVGHLSKSGTQAIVLANSKETDLKLQIVDLEKGVEYYKRVQAILFKKVEEWSIEERAFVDAMRKYDKEHDLIENANKKEAFQRKLSPFVRNHMQNNMHKYSLVITKTTKTTKKQPAKNPSVRFGNVGRVRKLHVSAKAATRPSDRDARSHASYP